jgi:hypothetical protein
MNEVIGSSAVGYGFDATGEYGPQSLKNRVFKKTFSQGKTFTYPPVGGPTYSVPDNMDVTTFSGLNGSTQAFQSQYDLQKYLALSAGISGSYNAFSGEISAAFTSAQEEWGSIAYVVTNAGAGFWTVTLANNDRSTLETSFIDVLDALPSTFDYTTLNTFFAFFKSFGTHYVSGVSAGGFFSYYQGVQNTGSTSLVTIKANCQLEYNAVFLDVAAKAQADWAQLGQQWTNSRTTTVSVTGGSAQSISDISPVYGTNDASGFSAWLGSIEANPSTINFNLTEWASLLPVGSDRQTAMLQALRAYMNYGIYLAVEYNGYSDITNLIVGGQQVLPKESWPQNPASTAQGIQIVLVDNVAALPVTYSAVYYINADGSNASQLFDQMMSDLKQYAFTNAQWCCLTVFNFPWGVVPDPRLLTWLEQFGVSGATWTDNYYNCGGGQASYSYIALGLDGSQGDLEKIMLNTLGADGTIAVSVNPYLQGHLTAKEAKPAKAAE